MLDNSRVALPVNLKPFRDVVCDCNQIIHLDYKRIGFKWIPSFSFKFPLAKKCKSCNNTFIRSIPFSEIL